MNRRSLFVVSVALAFSASVALVLAADEWPAKSSNVEDATGNLHVPSDYRELYEYLGSWSVADDDKAGAKQIHAVYASPGTREAFKRTGKFPDGTVLVKEQFEASTDTMTSGTASHQDKLNGWFVLVKDSTKRHPDNPLWGDGWGWSHFDVGAPTALPRLTTTTIVCPVTLPPRPPIGSIRWVTRRCVEAMPLRSPIDTFDRCSHSCL